jgi:hypothetical protein
VTTVFISHSSKDEKAAGAICAALEARSIACWMAARDVGPGDNFQESIVHAIRSAKAMVLVFTEAANTSGEIRKELALASQRGLTVIPARVENVEPTAALSYEMATRQWINLYDDWDKGIARLVNALSAFAAVPPTPIPPPKPEPKPEPKPAPKPKPQPAPKPDPLRDPAAGSGMGVLGGVLIAGGLVRLGLLANLLATISATFLFSTANRATTSVVLPILFGIATVAAGALLVKRANAARSFGIAVCALALAYQLFGLGSALYYLATAANTANYPWWTLGLSLGYLALYATGLVLLTRWHPERRNL